MRPSIDPYEQDQEDKRKLSRLLDTEELHSKEREAFESMFQRLEEGRSLSFKQRKWVEEKFDRLEFDAEAGAANLYSKGLVPRGREVETPAVLLNLPKKPPSKNSL